MKIRVLCGSSRGAILHTPTVPRQPSACLPAAVLRAFMTAVGSGSARTPWCGLSHYAPALT